MRGRHGSEEVSQWDVDVEVGMGWDRGGRRANLVATSDAIGRHDDEKLVEWGKCRKRWLVVLFEGCD